MNHVTPALGRDVGRQVAEAFGLEDIDNIRAIRIDLPADDVATVEIDRYVPTGNSSIGLSFQKYRLVPIDSTETEGTMRDDDDESDDGRIMCRNVYICASIGEGCLCPENPIAPAMWGTPPTETEEP